jgi:hypothetical protein
MLSKWLPAAAVAAAAAAAAAAHLAACRSSARDRDQDTFWSTLFRPLAAQEDSRSVATTTDSQQDSVTPSVEDPASLSNVEDRSHYESKDRYGPVDHARSRYGDDGEEPGYGDWPECRGTCHDGRCDLQKRHSGCCYLATTHEDSYYPTYGAAQAQAEDVGDAGKAAVPANTQRHRGMRVCW